MNIIDALKKRLEKDVVHEHLLNKQRKQLNMPVNIKLIDQIKRLSAEFSVSRYALVEHLLQVGCFYAEKTLKSRKIGDIVRTHLIDKHLLDNSYSDPEEILRLGEGRYASELLVMSKKIVKQYRDLQRAFFHAKRTGNIDACELARKQLFNSAVILADWLSSHSLDEIEDEED